MKVNKKVLWVSAIAAIVMVCGALLIGIMELWVHIVSSPVGFIDAGERWSAAGEPYAVISLYTEQDSALTKDQIEQYARSMDSALVSASIKPAEGGRSWAYCYSTETLLSTTGPKSRANAIVTVCGGDFFLFHPLKFRYGAPFLNDASIPNGVVIDENLAWKIFGAIDVVGMTMSIGEEELTVVGVTEAERSSEPYTYTYGETARMYMTYQAYQKTGGAEQCITAYEVTLPNPVRSFAMNIFKNAVSFNEDTTSVLESSARYGIMNRYENSKTLKYSWVRADRVIYPYWENEARMIDYKCARVMVVEVVLAALSIFCMLFSFILLRVSGFTLTAVIKKQWLKWEEARAKRPPKPKKQKVQKKGKKQASRAPRQPRQRAASVDSFNHNEE